MILENVCKILELIKKDYPEIKDIYAIDINKRSITVHYVDEKGYYVTTDFTSKGKSIAKK